MTDPADNAHHKARMQRKKSVVDAKIARADQDRGVLLVHTGTGKGKSSSAFGMVARALGHGMRVGVVQFIKGSYRTGEEAFFRRFPEVEYHVMGEGFTWETQDRTRDTRAAQAAWEQARRLLTDCALGLVVLDELNIALKHGYIPLPDVLAALRARPAHQPAVVPGRGGGTISPSRPTPLVAAYPFAAAAHNPAARSAAVGVPPDAVASSTLLACAWISVPSTASVWIAYCAARSLMISVFVRGSVVMEPLADRSEVFCDLIRAARFAAFA